MTDKKLKSIEEMEVEYAEGAADFIRARIRELGGDGVVSPDVCGCSLDEFPACCCDLYELDECYPAKGRMGEWEGMKCMLYHKLGEEEENGAE